MAAEPPRARDRRWIGLEPATARATWTILVIAAALALVYALRHVLLLIAFSVFFAYLIFPLIKAAQRWVPGLSTWTRAIALVYLVLLGALAVVGSTLGPRLTDELRGLAERVPQIAQDVSTGVIVSRTLQRYGWGEETIREIEVVLRSHAREILASAQGAAAGILKWLSGAWVIVLIPIFALFILKDGEAFVAKAAAFLGGSRQHRRWLSISRDLHHLLGEYMRALVLLSLITFVTWSIVFLISGVPYPVILAAVGGALEVIPLVGPVVAGVIVLSATAFAGYGHTLVLLGFIVAWRFIQDYVTSPMVMGRGIEIHPALVIFGVVAGGELAGPVGMFFSVPVIAALRIVWHHAGYRDTNGTD